MRRGKLNIFLTIGIIVLFVGASILPIIKGNIIISYSPNASGCEVGFYENYNLIASPRLTVNVPNKIRNNPTKSTTYAVESSNGD